ncbi:conserved hypothetical protein [Paecilomyces variotii No. 5]|uniref:Uncharacterized protein n=1 Tax=Byssochlamys spectabilis (strain No. 5 / NBRC 109023) TaxID=1356009 RepID=V5I068_BYSSN|nr:conserved hypothetical protein [Paecilomyces variotii No. 5]
MFFSADLKFFIEFEMKDREKRRILAEAGYVTKRQVPTAAEYLKHQEENGLVSSNASGGLYKRVFLIKNFTPVLYQIPKVMREWSTPKQWHGNPMASIRRAIAALGSPRFLLVDPTIRRDLERLRDLYFSDWSQIPGNDCLRGLNARDNKRYLEEQGSSNHPAKKVKEQKTEPDVGVANRTSPTDSSQTDTN